MSASLVGSEMCIRDRSSPAPGTHQKLANPSFSTQPWRSREKRVAPGLRPVSYTHLTLPTICSV
eukprot:12152863-Alexandrium_andersonii.AAC.1